MPTDAPSSTLAASTTAPARTHPPKESIKETLVSIIIAFVLAFVFRGFVIEAFVIPTGSMAPTLMGAHMRFRGSESGYSWPVGPWQETPTQGEYNPVQSQITVHDPMTGQRVEQGVVPRRSGDRILVLKFLYGIREPQRFDVVVFKCPYDPQTNFIKRLLGLPGEQVALVDGDVFARPESNSNAAATTETWNLPGWRIARKPKSVQDAVWQPVFDSRYAPLNPQRDSRTWYNPPWVGSTPGWKVDGPIYSFDAAGPARLDWDATRPRYDAKPPFNRAENWEIDDRYPYDEDPNRPQSWYHRFPVSDIRVRAGVEPKAPGLQVTATITARAHEFEAVISGSSAAIRMRPAAIGSEASAAPWTTLANQAIDPLPLGQVTDVEFSHVDQALQLAISGRLVASGSYDWSPAERIRFATGRELSQILADEKASARPNTAAPRGNIFADPKLFRPVQVGWSFSGAALRLHRVGLDRDLHYQATSFPPGPLRDQPAFATHPSSTLTLNPDEFFTCGDNSPASRDGRLWDDTDPWVKLIDPKPGIVPRDLMLGKAFFVYFPSLHKDGAVPVPDFGRLRFIR